MAIDEDIRDIRNDLDRVRQDIDSINRVQVLTNRSAILEDIKKLVGKSRQMVAALFLTKDWMPSAQLAEELSIDQSNLDKVVNALVEGGLLYREKRGRGVFYKRATRFDLIGFDREKTFVETFEAWKKSKNDGDDSGPHRSSERVKGVPSARQT